MIQTLSLIGIVSCIWYLRYAVKYYIELNQCYHDPLLPDYNRERMGLVLAILLVIMIIFFHSSMFIINFNSINDLQGVITYCQMIFILNIMRMYVGLSFYHKDAGGTIK